MSAASSAPDALVGKIVAGYRLERLIGVGASGAVYLGRRVVEEPTADSEPSKSQAKLPAEAAVKVLMPPWQVTVTEREDYRRRFEREAATLQRLRHPHIVSVLDYGHDATADVGYMVLPFLAGGTLGDLLARAHMPLPYADINIALTQLAGALDYAHSQNVIHRDIKPANILFGTNGMSYLTDFGIARLLAESVTKLTITGQMVGTPAYMAPEQMSGATVGPSADIYSLGMVLFKMVTGRVAFDATSVAQLVHQQLVEAPPRPALLRPDLPQAAEAVILRALAKSPVQRFGTAGELAHVFTMGLAGQWPAGLAGFAPDIAQADSPASGTTVHIPTPVPTLYAPPQVYLSPTLGSAATNPAWPIQGPQRHGVSPRVLLITFVTGMVGVAAGASALLLAGQRGIFSLGASATKTGTESSTQTGPGPLGAAVATLAGHTNYVDAVAWTPDGRYVCSASWDNLVIVWDVERGAATLTYRGHRQHVISVAWSPDGTKIASASDDGTVQIWNPADGTRLISYSGHTDGVWSVAWSPNGSLIASTGKDRTIQIWRPLSGESVNILTGHIDYVRYLAWSPDGGRLATASYDHTARVWDVASGSTVVTYSGHSDKVWAVSWSPQGDRVASGGDFSVHVWDASSGARYVRYAYHTGGTWTVAWSPRGQHIASGSFDTTVQIWNAADGSPIYTYRGHSASVNNIAWSPDGSLIASGGDDQLVRVWRAETR